MPGIDDLTIQRIKDAADIVDVVGDFVDLKKRGVRYLGLCPFHDDRHLGSFVVYPKKNVFKCFKCDAKGGPVEFIMKHEGLSFPDAIRWLGKKYLIDTDMNDFNYTPPPPRPKPAPLQMLTLPFDMVTSREDGREENTLVTWLRNGIGWDYCQRQRIDKVLEAYHLGTNRRNGMTIFWQIDERQRVRTGKMMKYYPEGHPKFGHRDRDTRYNFDWVHSALSRHRDPKTGETTYDPPYPFPNLFDPSKQEPIQTLFGMHLLNAYGQTGQVNIVESEKTAIIMAIAYGNHSGDVWMACGGIEMLSRERLAPIIKQHRRIVLYPDRDGIDRWRAKCENLRYDRLHINVEPVLKWWRDGDGEKADVADVVVRIINNAKTHIAPLTEQPEVKNLMEKLDLKEVHNEDETQTH